MSINQVKLSDFVSSTVNEVAEAVAKINGGAQPITVACPCIVGGLAGETHIHANRGIVRPMRFDFSLGLSAVNRDSTTGGGGIDVRIVNLGATKSGSSEQTTDNRVDFSMEVAIVGPRLPWKIPGDDL